MRFSLTTFSLPLRFFLSLASISIGFFSFLGFFSSLYAQPTGEKILHGDVSLQRTENNQNLIINSSSPKSILSWQSFSISQNEHTHFQLPSNDSASLNRVTGSNLSEIYGRLTSNGSIYLVNPSGILIGKAGIIQTQSFIATTLNIDNQEFLQGDPLHLSSPSDKASTSSASIKNEGFVEALDGNIFFIAKAVSNSGHLKASQGNVSLIGSTSVVLLLQDKNNPSIIIKQVTTSQSSPASEKEASSADAKADEEGKVENSGLIEAVQVELKASGYNLSSLAINQEGLIQATGFNEKEGKIILLAETGVTKVSGTLEAATIPALSNKNSIQGGEIQVLGDHVHITEEAKLIASGDLNGGTILVGGGFQGKNPAIRNSITTIVEHGSLIDISSFNEDAGRLVLWSDQGTFFDGEILATSVLGDGGFVEISSHYNLQVPGFVDTRSVHGKTGTLLLDPWDITISGGVTNVSSTGTNPVIYYGTATGAILNVATLIAMLATNNVKIDSDYAGTGAEAGNITIDAGAPISWSSSNYLELYAAGAIIVNDGITSTTGNITLTALGGTSGLTGIALASGTSISSTSGNITLTGTSGTTGNSIYGIALNTATISTTGGQIDISATANSSGATTSGLYLSASSISTTGAGNINITANGGPGSSSSYGMDMEGASSVHVDGTGFLTINTYGGTTGATNYGLYMHSSTAAIYSATTDLTINAYGGTGTSTSGNMGLRIITGSIYTMAGANIAILGQGGGTTTGNTGIFLGNATNAKIYTSAGGNITITANGSGSNSVGMNLTGQIYCTTTGNINIIATAEGTGSTADGLTSGASSTINTTTGDITIVATASGSGLGMSLSTKPATNDSIKTESGKISITATGGTTGSTAYGFSLNRSTISTTGGDIEISATSRATGGTNYGLFLTASIISTTSLLGTGNITIIATASPSSITINNSGLYLVTSTASPFNSSIATTDGDITIVATGGGSTTTSPSTLNCGIRLLASTATRSSSITTTGSTAGKGNITITSYGGKGTTNNCGILLDNTTGASYISTNVGNISINTTGGEGTTTNNMGLRLRVTSTGTSSYISTTSGNIDITAYPGSGTTDNYGIEINTKSYIKSSSPAGKHLNITTTGGEGDSSNHGLYLVNALTALLDPKIESGAADINIVATGGSGTTSNGFYSTLADNVVRTTTGNISITGYATDGYGIAVDAGTVSSTAGGTITYTADTFSMSSLATFPSSTLGTFVFQPISTSSSIGLGTAGGGSWNLTDGLVDQVAYATTNFTSTIIGRSDGSHTIVVDTSSTILDDLTLRGDTITITGALTAAAGKNITCNIGQTAAGTLNLNAPINSPGGTFYLNGSVYSDNFNIGVDTTTEIPTTSLDGGIIGATTNTLTGPNLTTAWTISAANAGTLGNITFTNITNIVGGSAIDDTLTNTSAGPDIWTISSNNGGTLLSIAFSSMEKLVGGAGNDTFSFSGNYYITGIGGVGIDGGGGTNGVSGPDSTTAWTVTASNAGTINPAAVGATNFQNVQNLTGGTGADSFSLADGFGITGSLNGGGGINTLDYSAYTSDVTINVATGTAPNIAGGFSNIQSFVGPAGQTNSLTGDNITNSWTITGSDQGTLNTGTFINFKNIYGGSVNDTFTFFVGGVITGTLDGEGGTNTLQGPNENTLWTISSLGAGSIIPASALATSFQNIQTVVGGSSNDTFRFADSAIFSFVDGGGNFPEWNVLVKW